MSTDPLATMREQLAAAQADNRALREALKFAAYDIAERACDACLPTHEAILRALSRPPGSREALREMLTKCALAVMDDDRVDYRGDDDAAPVCVAAAIVARLVPDAGQKGAEG